MKIRPVLDDLFHVDGQTDVTKVMVAFRNFNNNNNNNNIYLLQLGCHPVAVVFYT